VNFWLVHLVPPHLFRSCLPAFVSREYKTTPIEITENGCSYLDSPDERGRIPDERRIQFMRGYLHALGRAMLHGANVRAYHHWSLLDNFEWAEGYAQRFGLT
jgi:beta-glucosidase